MSRLECPLCRKQFAGGRPRRGRPWVDLRRHLRLGVCEHGGTLYEWLTRTPLTCPACGVCEHSESDFWMHVALSFWSDVPAEAPSLDCHSAWLGLMRRSVRLDKRGKHAEARAAMEALANGRDDDGSDSSSTIEASDSEPSDAVAAAADAVADVPSALRPCASAFLSQAAINRIRRRYRTIHHIRTHTESTAAPTAPTSAAPASPTAELEDADDHSSQVDTISDVNSIAEEEAGVQPVRPPRVSRMPAGKVSAPARGAYASAVRRADNHRRRLRDRRGIFIIEDLDE